MESFREDYNSIKEELATHKKKLKDVDISIKRLNGTASDKSIKNIEFPINNKLNVLNSNSNTRRVSLPEGENSRSSLKRKSYDDQKFSYSNIKRNTSVNADPDSCEDEPFERPTIKSSVVSSSMPIQSKDDLIKLQNRGASVQRNKRLFGHLLGTLSQFKSDDKVRSSTTQAIHRKELEKKIEVQKVEEKERDTEEKKKLEEEKSKRQQNIEILETKMRIAQEFEEWKKNQLQYKKFIRTKSKPYIFYLPKELDVNTEKLLNGTAALIDEQIEKKLKETNAELDVLTKKSARLNEETENGDLKNKKLQNKENTEQDLESSDHDEMEEEAKINVRLGDEEEEGEGNENESINESFIKNASTTDNNNVIEEQQQKKDDIKDLPEKTNDQIDNENNELNNDKNETTVIE